MGHASMSSERRSVPSSASVASRSPVATTPPMIVNVLFGTRSASPGASAARLALSAAAFASAAESSSALAPPSTSKSYTRAAASASSPHAKTRFVMSGSAHGQNKSSPVM